MHSEIFMLFTRYEFLRARDCKYDDYDLPLYLFSFSGIIVNGGMIAINNNALAVMHVN